MRLAYVNDEKTTAFKGGHGVCPHCGGDVLSKCGKIVSWHWAHKTCDCDPWSEPESEWHLRWKDRFPKDWQEISIGRHRCDVKTPKMVIEFQASIISCDEIAERENFYGRMVWVLRGDDFKNNIHFRQRDGYVSFRWRWPRKSWWGANRPVVIDTEHGLFNIKKIYCDVPCGGYGQFIDESDFFRFVGAPA